MKPLAQLATVLVPEGQTVTLTGTAFCGACADGRLEVTATGTITRYRDRNYLLLGDFATE